MAFSLKLLGRASLEGDGGGLTGRAVHRHRLGLLALLAGAHPRALSRDKLIAWLWPERDSERARGLLNQAVHVLRRTLGTEAILSAGDDLQLNPQVVACDLIAFEQAVAAGDLERAAALYAGPFLDGFFLSDAVEFDQWSERERQRLAASYARVLEMLAEKAEAAKHWPRAVDWWKVRVAQDPYHSLAVVRLMLALEASGNRAAALLQGDEHQRLLREELGIEPSPDVAALSQRLRSSPSAGSPPAPPWPAADFSRSVPAADGDVVLGPDQPASHAAGSRIGSANQRSPRRRLVVVSSVVAILTVSAVLIAVKSSARQAPSRSSANLPAGAVDEIARAVARELARREHGDTAERRPEHRTKSIAAYELYLRASDPAVLRSDSAARRAREDFRRAVAIDSTYAAAWAGLARLTLRAVGDSLVGESLSFAEEAARRAVVLDDSLAEAHATLGLIRMNRFDLVGAESEIERAMALEPRLPLPREWLVKIYLWEGRAGEALSQARRAFELTPLSPTANAELARALLGNGRYDEALAQLQKVQGLDPPLARVAGLVAQCYAAKRMWPEAIAAIKGQADQGAASSNGVLGYLLARAGRRDQASQVLAKLVDRSRGAERVAWPIALVYLGLGDVEPAVPWLERAVADRSLSPFIDTSPLAITVLNGFRRDPRIARVRERWIFNANSQKR
jgi:DNA-binding SARP family transcriptional activator